jgi:hypothetical protein
MQGCPLTPVERVYWEVALRYKITNNVYLTVLCRFMKKSMAILATGT